MWGGGDHFDGKRSLLDLPFYFAGDSDQLLTGAVLAFVNNTHTTCTVRFTRFFIQTFSATPPHATYCTLKCVKRDSIIQCQKRGHFHAQHAPASHSKHTHIHHAHSVTLTPSLTYHAPRTTHTHTTHTHTHTHTLTHTTPHTHTTHTRTHHTHTLTLALTHHVHTHTLTLTHHAPRTTHTHTTQNLSTYSTKIP
jgi:hypothetical protein